MEPREDQLGELLIAALKAAEFERAELDLRQARLAITIDNITRTLAQWREPSGSGAVASGSRDEPGDQPAPSMREAIMDLLQESGGIQGSEAAALLAEKWGWSPASVRSMLSKMARDGLVDNRIRGFYRPPESTRDRTSWLEKLSSVMIAQHAVQRPVELTPDQAARISAFVSGLPQELTRSAVPGPLLADGSGSEESVEFEEDATEVDQ